MVAWTPRPSAALRKTHAALLAEAVGPFTALRKTHAALRKTHAALRGLSASALTSSLWVGAAAL